MAQHTQLRFNLAVPPNPANLASSLTSSPSPVVIQRVRCVELESLLCQFLAWLKDFACTILIPSSA